MINERPLLTKAQYAREVGESPQLVNKYVKIGEIPVVAQKITKTMLFIRSGTQFPAKKHAGRKKNSKKSPLIINDLRIK